MKKKKAKSFNNSSVLYVSLLFLATIFMGVGFASVNKEFVSISGSSHILTPNGLYITRVTYVSDNGADLQVSKINDFNGKVLNSTIKLGTSSSSTITYSITITNNTLNSSSFSGTSYSPSFYDNPNITFQLSGINVGDIVAAGASKTFNITFQYTGNNTSNQILNSYISFDFDNFYTITYEHINTTGQNYPNVVLQSESTKTITFTGDVPYDVSISPNTITYTYNHNTGVLMLSNVDSNVTIDRYYSLTFITAGTNPSTQPDKYLHGDIVSFQNPINGNNYFDGWYLNSSYTGSPITSTANHNEDLIMYAKWITPYTITYILNGGVQADNQVTSFVNQNPQNILNPTNTHDSSFAGWYQNSGLTGTIVTSTSSLSGNSTLYAKWESTINDTNYNTSNNRFIATNVSNLGLRNLENNQYTQNTANTTINSVKIYLTYTSSNKNATVTCQINNNTTSITLNTNQNNVVAEGTINLNTPISSGSSYTISCPSHTGDNNNKIKVNGLEFIINP